MIPWKLPGFGVKLFFMLGFCTLEANIMIYKMDYMHFLG